MVRVTSYDTRNLTKMEELILAECPQNTEVFIAQHGNVVRVCIQNVRKLQLDINKIKDIAKEFFIRENYNEFDAGYWCTLYYR